MSSDNFLADKIFSVLPKTQCRKCGYPTCKDYARAVAQGEHGGKCYPGGLKTKNVIAEIIGRDDGFSHEISIENRSIAKIDENSCIGCTLCQDVCPTDAIIGAKPFLHTVLESSCSGCGLCEEVCPVKCISLLLDSNLPATVFSETGLSDSMRFQKEFEAKEVRKSEKLQIKHKKFKHRDNARSLLSELKSRIKVKDEA